MAAYRSSTLDHISREGKILSVHPSFTDALFRSTQRSLNAIAGYRADKALGRGDTGDAGASREELRAQSFKHLHSGLSLLNREGVGYESVQTLGRLISGSEREIMLRTGEISVRALASGTDLELPVVAAADVPDMLRLAIDGYHDNAQMHPVVRSGTLQLEWAETQPLCVGVNATAAEVIGIYTHFQAGLPSPVLLAAEQQQYRRLINEVLLSAGENRVRSLADFYEFLSTETLAELRLMRAELQAVPATRAYFRMANMPRWANDLAAIMTQASQGQGRHVTIQGPYNAAGRGYGITVGGLAPGEVASKLESTLGLTSGVHTIDLRPDNVEQEMLLGRSVH